MPVKFKRNHITQAILRLDFAESPSPKVHLKLKKELQGMTKSYSESLVQQATLEIKQKNSSIQTKTVGKRSVWEIESGRFELSHDAFVLVLDKYHDFAHFFDQFQRGLVSLESSWGEGLEFKRVGLRYVNEFCFSKVKSVEQWDAYFNKAFSGSYKAVDRPVAGFELLRNVNAYYYRNDDVRVTLRNGVWNDQFPRKSETPNFVVDVDCFIDALIFNTSYILQMGPRLNEVALSFFLKVILPKMRTELREIK